MKLPAGTPLTFIELVYLAGRRPAVQVPSALSPGVERLITGWSTFEPTRGVIDFLTPHDPLAHTSMRISAVSADDAMAQTLDLAPGSPLLRFATLGLARSGAALYRNVWYQSGDLLDVHILRPFAVP